jgi:Anti-sigma-K factor rskA, C-terminal
VSLGHEQIDELLAGYVLGSLSGEDAAQADRLLTDHVPTCAACRETLTAFQGVAADLALDAPPLSPPDTLLPRLHREMGPPERRRRPLQMFAVAASVVVVAGLAGLAVTQTLGRSHSQARADALSNAMNLAAQPNANLVPVGPATEISAPGQETFYLYGQDVPSPPAGMEYRVWLVSGTSATFAGRFLPENGFVALEVHFDPSRFDGLWVTVEPSSSDTSTAPQASDVLWHAAS